MKYSATIDVPALDAGIAFYAGVFGFVETARPLSGYAVLTQGEQRLGIIQKEPGSRPVRTESEPRHWSPVHLDFHVEDFEAVLKAALAAGAVVDKRFDGGPHPAVAFCADPFGNGFCIVGPEGDAPD
ncbi:VOC family protein [Thalassococcus sp. CAU 1522]|uniref:VOC family protein n=1 Tax=Thalassococcus arenae TaxID=2851652 RepID=A0ABS6N4Z9_9RHOB|nr:VOC family protein [Thalassococcus arenae]MBV2359077.1 VOC family protein [Thalassococcus arenae]